jgi:hypothetical protein
MALPLPGLDVPVIDLESGRMTQAWYSYFQGHQKLTQLPDFSPVAPLDGQWPKWNDTTKIWVPTT